MSVDYTKLLAPLVGSVIGLIAVTQLAVETLGLLVKYIGGAIAIGVIALYVFVGGYAVLIRLLTKIGNLAWGDVLERHLYTDEEITKDDVPHWSRIWIAYASSLLREWLQGNFKWVSFEAYHDDMVTPLLEDDGEQTQSNSSASA